MKDNTINRILPGYLQFFLDSLTEQFKLGLTACHLSQYSVIIIFSLFNNFFLKLLLNMRVQLMSTYWNKDRLKYYHRHNF